MTESNSVLDTVNARRAIRQRYLGTANALAEALAAEPEAGG